MNGSTQGRNLTNPLVFGVLGLVGILILGMIFLVALGRDVDQTLTVVGPTVVTLLGIVTVLAKTDRVEQTASRVEDVNTAQNETIATLHAQTNNIAKRVNGELDAKFRNLNSRIDGLSNQVKLANNLNVPATEISDDPPSETQGS